MTILNDEDFIWGFVPGCILHTIIWTFHIKLFALQCVETGCQSLMILDMPVSMFYFFLGDSLRVLLSFVLGGIQWGLVGWLIYKLIRIVVDSRQKGVRKP